MDRWTEMEVLVQIAETGTLGGAAEALGLTFVTNPVIGGAMTMDAHRTRQLRRTDALGFVHLPGLQVTQGPCALRDQGHLTVALGLGNRLLVKAMQGFVDAPACQVGDRQQRRCTKARYRIVIRQGLETFQQGNDRLGAVALLLDPGAALRYVAA